MLQNVTKCKKYKSICSFIILYVRDFKMFYLKQSFLGDMLITGFIFLKL